MNLFNILFSKKDKARGLEVNPEWYVETRYNGAYYVARMKRMFNVYPEVEPQSLEMVDRYDYTRNVLCLTMKTLDSCNAVAVATACHEVGHAVAYLSGFKGTPLQNEQKATSIALEFLKNELNEEQYNAASAFLHACMETY
ncbi:MAG: zinc metallopeptidase [Bacteroidales bacterium]|nr:zinc metallopeptidase [Bacteroidales bacterium]